MKFSVESKLILKNNLFLRRSILNENNQGDLSIYVSTRDWRCSFLSVDCRSDNNKYLYGMGESRGYTPDQLYKYIL